MIHLKSILIGKFFRKKTDFCCDNIIFYIFANKGIKVSLFRKYNVKYAVKHKSDL